MENEKILKNTLLFTKISEKQLSELVLQIEEIRISGGITFIREGDNSDALYVIKEGVLQVFTSGKENEEIILARLEKGSFFGEQALLTSTPGLRNASVRTLSDSVLLKVSHKVFLSLLEEDETLKKKLQKIGFQQLAAKLRTKEYEEDILRLVYQSPIRGELTQYVGHFLKMPAVISKFKQKDGREIIACRVIGKNIQSISENIIENPEISCYEDKNLYRELQLVNGILVSVTSYGEWSSLKELCSRVFDGKGITDAELKHFKSHGELIPSEKKIVLEEDENEVVCTCLCVTRGEIASCIKNGCSTVDEISDLTGAGTICSSCVPTIQSMLGHEAWQAMYILKIEQLRPDIRIYQLAPVKNKPLPHYHAGQHIVIQCAIKGRWVERSYTLTSSPQNSDYYEIAIKREERGLLSRWLFDNDQTVPFIRVSDPSGHFILNTTKSSPIVFFTAGIGITPAVSFARTIGKGKPVRTLHIYTSAHNREYLLFDSELESLSNMCPQIIYNKQLTEQEGRLTAENIKEIILRNTNADFYICGPKGYENMVKSTLHSMGINNSQIMIEQFTNAYGP